MTAFSQTSAVAQAALDLELRKRAARQAAGALSSPKPVEKVRVRVLKLGADKIGMGIHIAGIGDAHYERDEEFDAELPIAQALEDRGYVEIIGEGTGQLSTVELAMQNAADAALVAEEAAAADRAAAGQRAEADAAERAAAAAVAAEADKKAKG